MGRSKPTRKGYRSRTTMRSGRKRPRAPAVTERQVMNILNRRTGGLLGLEHKFLDQYNLRAAPETFSTLFNWEFVQADATAGFRHFNAIAQGDGNSNRDGEKCSVDSIQWRCRYFINGGTSASSPNNSVIRFVMFVDKSPNGAYPNAEEPFIEIPTDEDDVTSFLSLAQVPQRFMILKDKTFTVPHPQFVYNGTNYTWAGRTGVFKLSYKFKTPLMCNWVDTGGAIANLVSNAIYLVACTNDLGFQLVTASRVRFRG